MARQPALDFSGLMPAFAGRKDKPGQSRPGLVTAAPRPSPAHPGAGDQSLDVEQDQQVRVARADAGEELAVDACAHAELQRHGNYRHDRSETWPGTWNYCQSCAEVALTTALRCGALRRGEVLRGGAWPGPICARCAGYR